MLAQIEGASRKKTGNPVRLVFPLTESSITQLTQTYFPVEQGRGGEVQGRSGGGIRPRGQCILLDSKALG